MYVRKVIKAVGWFNCAGYELLGRTTTEFGYERIPEDVCVFLLFVTGVWEPNDESEINAMGA
jgi:hypothetical protein